MPKYSKFGDRTPGVLVGLLIALSRKTFLGRGRLRKLILYMVRFLHPGTIDTHLWGVPMRLDHHTNMSEHKPLLRLDRYDNLEREFMRASLTGVANPVFVDIGANIGLYSLDAVLNGPANTMAIAIEPQPQIIDRLLFNIAAIAGSGETRVERIKVVPCAVGADNGVARLETPRLKHLARIVERGGIEVPMKTLFRILEEEKIDHIDCLKIDIEGFEGEALGPFLQHAADHLLPNTLLFEHTHSEEWTNDILGLLSKRGYSEISRTRGNAMWSRR